MESHINQIKSIFTYMNTCIQRINNNYHRINLSSPLIKLIYNESISTLYIIITELNNNTSEFEQTFVISLNQNDTNMINAFIQQAQVLNCHINFKFYDSYMSEPFIDIHSSSLIIPTYKEIISHCNINLNGKLKDENIIKMNININDNINVEIIILIHCLFNNALFDCFIFKKRLFDYNNSNIFNGDIYIYIIKYIQTLLKINISNENKIISNNYTKTPSIVIILNFDTTNKNTIDNYFKELDITTKEIEYILNIIKDEILQKFNQLIQQIDLEYHLGTIANSLELIYQNTRDQTQYDLLENLFYNKEIFKRLYNNYSLSNTIFK